MDERKSEVDVGRCDTMADEKEPRKDEDPCASLKKRYEKCFNHWYTEEFLKGQLEPKCQEEFEEYRDCVVVRGAANDGRTMKRNDGRCAGGKSRLETKTSDRCDARMQEKMQKKNLGRVLEAATTASTKEQ